MAKNKDIKRGVTFYLNGHEVEKTTKAIQKEMRLVRTEMSKATIGSKEYMIAMEKWKQLNSILEEHKNKMKDIGNQGGALVSKMKEWFGQGLVSAFSLKSLDQLYDKLAQFRDLYNAREENAANLKALTGLDDANIAWLTEQASKLSTTMDETGLRVTQSSAEILNAYMLVGSAKPELLGNAEALNAVTVEAMRLSTAAKMDLQDAVKGVTLALNQYGAGVDEAAKYVNVLAAGSKAGAADVVAQTAAIVKAGVAASSANIPIEQLVGSIETLAEKGIMNEVAGTGLKSFFLTLEGGAKDCRPSVVGLETALQNLAAKNMDVTELTKMFGKEAVNIAQILISSADKVHEYTAAVTGTNVATEQAAINSDTAVKKMAQLQNQVNEAGMALWESLVPAFNVALEAGSKFLNIISGVINFLTRNISVVGRLALAYVSYKIAIAAAQTYEKAHIALMVKKRNIIVANIAAQRGNTAALQNHTLATKLASAASLLFQGKIKAATISMHAFNAAIKANPVGLIVSGLATLASFILPLFSGKTDEATEKVDELSQSEKNMKEVNESVSKSIAEEKMRVEALHKTLTDANASYDEKRKALTELKKIVPGYHATLSQEGKLLKENKSAIDDYVKSLQTKAMAEAFYKKLVEINEKIIQQQADLKKAADLARRNTGTFLYNDRHGAYSGRYTSTSPSRPYGNFGDTINARNARKEAEERREADQRKVLNSEKKMEEAQNRLKDTQKEQADLLKEIGKDKDVKAGVDLLTKSGSSSEVATPVTAPAVTTSGKAGKAAKPTTTKTTKPTKTGKVETEEEKERKRIQEAMAKIDLEYKEKALQLEKDLLEGKITSEAEYQRKSEGLELERLNKLLDIANLEPEKRLEIEDKVIELKLKTVEKLEQLSEDLGELDENSFAKLKEDVDKWQQDSLTILDQAHEQGLISEEEYGKKREAIAKEYAKRIEDAWNNSSAGQRGQQTNDTAGDLAKKYDTDAIVENAKATSKGAVGFYKNIMASYNEMVEQQTKFEPGSPEYEQLEEQKRNLIEWFTTNAMDIQELATSLGESLGAGLGESIMGNMDGLKDALKSVLMTILDAVEKMILAATVSVGAKGITTEGISLLKDLPKLVAIKAAFAVAKAAINSFDVGGYTGTGQWNEPAGIVHKGEFVANRFALANPAVKRVLDLIDNAQRSGDIANLSSQDIAAVGAPGYAAGGYVARSSAARVAAHGGDADTRRLLRECTLMLRTMKARFDEPIVAQTYLNGHGGWQEAYELKTKIENNAKRRSTRS